LIKPLNRLLKDHSPGPGCLAGYPVPGLGEHRSDRASVRSGAPLDESVIDKTIDEPDRGRMRQAENTTQVLDGSLASAAKSD
jgi:hypothetical protein